MQQLFAPELVVRLTLPGIRVRSSAGRRHRGTRADWSTAPLPNALQRPKLAREKRKDQGERPRRDTRAERLQLGDGRSLRRCPSQEIRLLRVTDVPQRNYRILHERNPQSRRRRFASSSLSKDRILISIFKMTVVNENVSVSWKKWSKAAKNELGIHENNHYRKPPGFLQKERYSFKAIFLKNYNFLGIYLITEFTIKAVRDCSNVNGISGVKSNKVADFMKDCDFYYNECLCEKSGEQSLKPGCDCYDADTCHANANLPGGYHCAKVSAWVALSSNELFQCPFGYMGEHCKKSIFFIGSLAISIISLTSLAGAVLAPMRSWPIYPDLQSGMVALAIGCLSGDAVLHLIPVSLFSSLNIVLIRAYDRISQAILLISLWRLSSACMGMRITNTKKIAITGTIRSIMNSTTTATKVKKKGKDSRITLSLKGKPITMNLNDVLTTRGLMLLLGLYIFYLFETGIGLWHSFKQAKQDSSDNEIGARRKSSKSRHYSESGGPGHKLRYSWYDFFMQITIRIQYHRRQKQRNLHWRKV